MHDYSSNLFCSARRNDRSSISSTTTTAMGKWGISLYIIRGGGQEDKEKKQTDQDQLDESNHKDNS